MNPMFVSAGLASLAHASCSHYGIRTSAAPEREGKVKTPQVAVIKHLPHGYLVVEHDGKRYFQKGDVFYQSHGNGYVVVRDPH